MKTRHDGDCTIYATLDNTGMPEAGICTCGYGLQLVGNGDYSEIYSDESVKKLERDSGGRPAIKKRLGLIEKLFDKK